MKKLREANISKEASPDADLSTVRAEPTTNDADATQKQTITQHITNVKKATAHIQSRMEEERIQMNRNKQNNLGAQLNQTMLNTLIGNMQVAEVYSPPGIVKMANKMGFRGGWSLDLTANDDYGMPWDFNDARMRRRAISKIVKDKPLVLIGSPMCTEYSSMNGINHSKMPREEVEARLDYARRHFEFCIKLYETEWQRGRYFLHEYPAGASPWEEAMMKRLMSRNGVQRVVGDQCQYGFKATDN